MIKNRRVLLFAALAALPVLSALLLWGWLALAPVPPLLHGVSFSPLVLDGQGNLLRLGLSADEKYRVRTPLGQVAPDAVRAALLYEDRHFYRHPGVNPLALARAAAHMLAGGRRMGGSTLTMQVARLRLGLDTSGPGGKLVQMLRALQLEYHYSKQEILEGYFNLAPYGGNVEGIGAAARVFFHSDPGRLTLAQCLALTPVPQNPGRRGPLAARADGAAPEFLAARQRMHALWRAEVEGQGAQDAPGAVFQSVTDAPPLRVYSPAQLPFAAPHLAAELLPLARQQANAGGGPVRTYIDPALQGAVESAIHHYAARGRAYGLRNAAALLLHWPDMQVRALAGSADFHDAAIAGQVDGSRARRSPGSTLKPFIYGLALDQGLIHPQTLLPDAPRTFGGYAPENFDGNFRGPLPAHEALRASRNVPAVWLASRLTPGLYEFLRRAGTALEYGPEHYGLSLVLGGAEVTMRELAGLYAMLANGGVWRAPRWRQGEESPPGLPLLSPEAAHVTLRMLEDGRHMLRTRQGVLPLRLKTGTSNGFRDAWAAGVVGPYVLVVWAGNFDNSPNPLLVGGEVAAPLFEDMARAVQLARPMGDPLPAQARELNLTRLSVCADTGDLETSLCADTTETWYIPGRSPTRPSGVYRTILVDEDTGLRACRPAEEGSPAQGPGVSGEAAPGPGQGPRRTREEVWEFWPTDLRALFLRAGIVKRQPPPFGPECAQETPPGNPPRLLQPRDGVVYYRRLSDPARSRIPLTASVDADASAVFWFVEGRFLGKSAPGEPLLWQPGDGAQQVRAVDDLGRAASRRVVVRTLP